MRPVRLPPCAAGREPDDRRCGRAAVPSPVTGRPQYSWSAKDGPLDLGDLLAPGDQPRAGPADRRPARRAASSDGALPAEPRDVRRGRAPPGSSRFARSAGGRCRAGSPPADQAIPSRMSCSLTTTSAQPEPVDQRESTSAPAPMTSTRPGCMTGSAARSARVIASSRVATARDVGGRDARQVDARRRRTPRSPSASAATVVTEPARPTAVRACSTGTTSRGPAASAASMSASAAATWRAVGGSSAQVPLGQPDAADVDRQRRLGARRARGPARWSRRRCR